MGAEQREHSGEDVRESLVTRKPWYKRKRYMIPLGVFGALVVIGLLNPATPSLDTSNSTPLAATPTQAPPVHEPPVAPPVSAPPAPPPVAPPVAEAPAPVETGSAQWLLTALRDDDARFNQLSDEQLISLADKTCDYREANGPSGQAIEKMARDSGFNEAQAEALTMRTYVYCTKQSG